jgi:hypothetical protein
VAVSESVARQILSQERGGGGYGTTGTASVPHGDGGGTLRFLAGGALVVSASGSITADGQSGDFVIGSGSKGGGGAGGIIVLASSSSIANDGQISASGGAGGNGPGTGSGGGGGGGIVHLLSPVLTGGVILVNGGTGGVNGAGGAFFNGGGACGGNGGNGGFPNSAAGSPGRTFLTTIANPATIIR